MFQEEEEEVGWAEGYTSLSELRCRAHTMLGLLANSINLDFFGTILFALNEHDDPATKRAEHTQAGLETTPDIFTERYERLLQTPPGGKGRREVEVLKDTGGRGNRRE